MPTYLVDTAQIEWQEDNPVSKIYGDIYWHRGSPLDEKAQVFLEPLLTLVEQPPERSQVTVCELGFGFGMNCLLTAQAWQQMPSSCQLNFVSIEKHPVDKEELEKFLKGLNFPHTEKLLAGYPPAYRGQHVVWLAPNIRLLLIFDEVEDALGNLDAEVDCWYLDGFAPAKNEAMWQAPLFRKMFARSRPGAQVATYSAAGDVRRGLERSGFETAKRPGFGQKREMLTATKPGGWSPETHGRESVSIVGAGIAGLFCYEALSRRGLSAELYDSGKAGPSAIPQLTVLPQLARAAETRYRFSNAASQYMRDAAGFYESGLHWIGRTEEEIVRLKKISELFPDNLIEARSDGAFYRNAGWLSFSELRDELSPSIIERNINHVEDLSSDHVILATGFNRSLLPEQLQVRAIRGQAIEVRTSGIQHVVNSQATIFPTVNGKSVISGTYENIDSDVVREEETKELINTARKYVELDDSDVIPWTGIRAVSRDRLPIVGQAPDWRAAAEVNRVSAIREFQPGLHYCTAFASRGATHARLCAEHVVSKLLGEPAALGLEEQHLLSPARFVVRDRLL